MTINSLQLNNSTAIGGLGTQTFNVLTSGMYTVEFKIFIPYIAAGSSANSTAAAPSALSVVVNLNGSAKLTVSSPGATQPFVAGSVTLSPSAGDTITVVLTSSNAADNALNAIKGIVNVFQGEG